MSNLKNKLAASILAAKNDKAKAVNSDKSSGKKAVKNPVNKTALKLTPKPIQKPALVSPVTAVVQAENTVNQVLFPDRVWPD